MIDPTVPMDGPHQAPRQQVLRESAALGLIAVGVVGLITAAFLTDPLAGAAALSAAALLVGLVLAFDR